MKCEICKREIEKKYILRAKALKEYQRKDRQALREKFNGYNPFLKKYQKATAKAEKTYKEKEKRAWKEYEKVCKKLGLPADYHI